MNTFTSMQNILATATCLHDHAAIQEAIDKMAEKIQTHDLSKQMPIFMGVAVGGLFLLSSLTLRLDFPLEFDFIQVSSYKANMYASKLEWKTLPQLDVTGRTIVIVDDILDTGLTLKSLVDFFEQRKAKQVLTAVLINKKVKRAEGGLDFADFVGLEVEDKFVFGYGLDYKGFWRNAAGIYEPADEYKK